MDHGARQHPARDLAIPCFNEERYIEACIDDVFAQDYPADRIEVLVGDGLSTDRTREILAAHRRTRPSRAPRHRQPATPPGRRR